MTLPTIPRFWYLFLETVSPETHLPTAVMGLKGLSQDFELMLDKALALKASQPELLVGLYQERRPDFVPSYLILEDMDVIVMECDLASDPVIALNPELVDRWPF